MTSRRKPPRRKARAEDTTTKPICWRLFTIQQAASLAGEPVRQICRWILTGRLKAYCLAGGLRIDEVELADFLSSPESRRS